MIAVLGKINANFNKADALRDGFDVGAVIGNVISMRMPVEWLREDFNYPGIEYIEVAERLDPDLDGGIKDIRADLVHQGNGLPQAYTGKGVIIGVADWGFDYTHPTFYDTSLTRNRILAAWDQVKIIGTPPDGFSHGAVYMDTTQLRLAQSDTVSNTSEYHGTHVAGIAGGSGAGTIYRGVAFESDLLFSQMRRDASSGIDAFNWMYNVAQAEGKRLVINNSWGSYRTNPLDGTSLTSQVIETLTDQGVVFVNSGANNGDINFHLQKTFDNDTVKTRVMGFNYNSDNSLWGQTVSMWGESGHPFAMQLRMLNGGNELQAQSDLYFTETAPAYVDTFLVINDDTIFYNITTDAAHPLNDRPQMTLNVQCRNQSLRTTLYVEAESGTVHFWNSRLTENGGGNWGYAFTAPTNGFTLGDRNCGIGHPGISTSAITVAAHVTDSWITGFSSYGPRMDGLAKPDISAPGQSIASALNSYASGNFNAVASVDFNGRTYEFIRLSGTSMSAPMVAGAVALLLEADPTLSAHDVKSILMDYAREDGNTGPIGPEGNVRWGQGKLDIYNAIQSLVVTHTNDAPSNSWLIYPNPASDLILLSGDINGTETIQLITLDGRLVKSWQGATTLNVQDVVNGIYLLVIEDGARKEIAKVMIDHRP